MIGYSEARTKVQNKKEYHEALVRNGFAPPALKSKFVNSEILIAIREGRIFCPRYENMIMRPCPCPPSQLEVRDELVKLIQNGIAQQAAEWRPRFQMLVEQLQRVPADRDWMLLVLSTLSQGDHVFFSKGYVAPPKQKAQNLNQFQV